MVRHCRAAPRGREHDALDNVPQQQCGEGGVFHGKGQRGTLLDWVLETAYAVGTKWDHRHQ